MLKGPRAARARLAAKALFLANVAYALLPIDAIAQNATAASPLLDQAAKQADRDQDDDAGRWPDVAVKSHPQAVGATPSSGGDAASVSIAEASQAAAQGDEPSVSAATGFKPSALPVNAPAAVGETTIAAGQAQTDSATMRRIAMKLVALGFLGRADDADDPAVLSDAVRAYQGASGIAPTGTLDRDTIGRLLS